MSLKKCYVCKNNEFHVFFKHLEWNKPVLKCKKCNHVALYDSVNNKNNSSNFSSNEKRADRYITNMEHIEINSLLEIGSPDDVYFLKKFHNKYPNVKLYSFDIFQKKSIPEFINIISLDKKYTDDDDITFDFLEKIKDMQFDIIYCTHVFEHISNINDFIQILDLTKYFIFEIPVYNEQYFNAIQTKHFKTTSYHYQFFNTKNIVDFFKNHNIKCKILHFFDDETPFNKGNVIITNTEYSFSKNFIELYNNIF